VRRRVPIRSLLCGLAVAAAACRSSGVPSALTDAQFWSLSEALSEPPGSFPLSENFVSNEPRVSENARWIPTSGGVYIGVGPEQNFTYVARLRPVAAFIIDIRRENRNLHLLYKALFELSNDRVEFVSSLFSRPRPEGLASNAGVREIFARFAGVSASAGARDRTFARVRERLLDTHRLPLTPTDLEDIRRALAAFHDGGPDIDFWGPRAVDGHAVRPSYRQLMTAPDLTGQSRSFLADDSAFRAVKDLQASNLIVPVIGDFGGPAAIRRVGQYVREHGTVVRAFYGSNVGVYLNTRQTVAFCASLATLPVADETPFIESDSVRPLAAKLKACAPRGR
jgi:hypothetical protein